MAARTVSVVFLFLIVLLLLIIAGIVVLIVMLGKTRRARQQDPAAAPYADPVPAAPQEVRAQSQASLARVKRYCVGCGAELTPNGAFCPYCGTQKE